MLYHRIRVQNYWQKKRKGSKRSIAVDPSRQMCIYSPMPYLQLEPIISVTMLHARI